MLRELRFLWHFRKNRFVRALAVCNPWDGKTRTDRELWALYRLGMYETVARAPAATRMSWRGVFAKAVSQAACGDTTAAEEAIAAFQAGSHSSARRAALADALAPFMPAHALQLLDGLHGVSPALRAAVLMRNGLVAEARALLDRQDHQAAHAWPELHLLRTNACGGTPEEQLHRLNAFLATHNVPGLRLLDASRPPSPGNVEAAHAPSGISGPLVTVLMTTYNTGARAAAAIRSVLSQSYRDIQLVVVDDASRDDTAAVVKAATAGDARAQFVPLPRNVGTYAAKLIGLSFASGEFVTCHDSDDWSHPEKIARQVAPMLSNPGLVCSVSSWVRVQDDGIFYARPVHPLMRINPSSPLFRRERVLREAGAWDCVRTGADSEFLARLRVVFGSNAIKKISAPLALGSHRPGSLMTAAGTGYSESGMSPQRLAYWEAWSRWHIETVSSGRTPLIGRDVRATVARPFPVPEALQVCGADLARCLTETGVQ
nr:glycosyltransferase family 2 protein [uncultured Caldimonas sp.]